MIYGQASFILRRNVNLHTATRPGQPLRRVPAAVPYRVSALSRPRLALPHGSVKPHANKTPRPWLHRVFVHIHAQHKLVRDVPLSHSCECRPLREWVSLHGQGELTPRQLAVIGTHVTWCFLVMLSTSAKHYATDRNVICPGRPIRAAQAPGIDVTHKLPVTSNA